MNSEKQTLEEAHRQAAFRCAALFADFAFKHECRSFCDAYVVALRMLGESAKSQWTQADVVEAVHRAMHSTNYGTGRPARNGYA